MIVLNEIETILERYRSRMFNIEELKDMRAELSILLVTIGYDAAEAYENLHRAEYDMKKTEAEIYMELRKTRTAADSERLAKITSESEHLNYIEHLGLYKRFDNMRQALMKVLDSMAAIMKDVGTHDVI